MKLATVVSHPIQYYSPWFKFIKENTPIQNKVFYLWDYGVKKTYDQGFKKYISWNLPLLQGYDHEILENISQNPGTHHFYGLNNPTLVDRLLEFEPQVILLFGYFSFSHLKVLFSKKLQNIPKLLKGDSHRLFCNKNFINFIKKNIIKALFEKFSAALYVGSANKDYFIKNGFSQFDLFFSPHAVDQTRFYPDEISRKYTRSKWNVGDEEKLIIFCGKFERKKCPVELAKVFTKNKNQKLRLFYVGSGELESEIRKISDKDDRVKIIGFIDQAQMPEAYRASDYVILPSYGPDETWGFCLHEAISCGTKVIASDHVGCVHDLVQDGENGFIFQAGNWSGLSEILQRIKSCKIQEKNMDTKTMCALKSYSYQTATFGLISALEYLVNGK